MIQWADANAVEEAKAKITEEFISKYKEFLADAPNGESREFGMKYGILLTPEGIEEHSKDTQATLLWFQKRIFSGRWIQNWEKAGYDRHVIWELSHQGFLADKEYSNWHARASGHTSFYYIPQRVAKEIYKEYRRK